MIDECIRNEVIAFAQEIIRINSPSCQEGEVAGLVERKMNTLNYYSVQVDSFGNVIGTRIGKFPGPVILFDGHMDVVPVTNPQEWSCDPFSADIREGKIWGLGATDMKGPLAAAIVALGHIPAEDIHGTLVISATVAEELNEGVAITKVLKEVIPDFVVICEPSDCYMGVGQKGRAGIWVDVSGKSAHSSQPLMGENAIYKAMKVIERLRRMTLPSNSLLGEGIMELIDGISSPYPSQSTLPFNFRMHYDRRLLQEETIESVLDSIKTALEGLPDWKTGFLRIKSKTYTGKIIDELDFHPGWILDSASPWIKKAQAGLQMYGLEPQLFFAQYCTNGSQTAGVEKIPTMIFGPSSVSLAHHVDEYIEINELLRGFEGYTGLAKSLGHQER